MFHQASGFLRTTRRHNSDDRTFQRYLVIGSAYISACSAVARQRLGKHVPVDRKQALINVTPRIQQWKNLCFYVVRAEVL
jgi:hypothetical protein